MQSTDGHRHIGRPKVDYNIDSKKTEQIPHTQSEMKEKAIYSDLNKYLDMAIVVGRYPSSSSSSLSGRHRKCVLLTCVLFSTSLSMAVNRKTNTKQKRRSVNKNTHSEYTAASHQFALPHTPFRYIFSHKS